MWKITKISDLHLNAFISQSCAFCSLRANAIQLSFEVLCSKWYVTDFPNAPWLPSLKLYCLLLKFTFAKLIIAITDITSVTYW